MEDLFAVLQLSGWNLNTPKPTVSIYILYSIAETSVKTVS